MPSVSRKLKALKKEAERLERQTAADTEKWLAAEAAGDEEKATLWHRRARASRQAWEAAEDAHLAAFVKAVERF